MVSAISDVVLPQGSTGQSRQSADAGTQDFSTVLSGKVSSRQQVTPSQANPVANNGAGSASNQAAGDTDAQSATPDLLAEKIDAKLNAGGQAAADDVAPVTATPVTDTASTPQTLPAAPVQDADPALDSSAAATLAALLAQTQPAAAQANANSAANADSLAAQTANANGVSPTGLASQDTGSDADAATGATSAATAGATTATTQAAADAAKAAVPLAEVLSNDKTGQPDASTALKIKLPAAIENAAAKAKATATAMPAKSALPHGDTAQTTAQVTPTVAVQDSGDNSLATTASNDTTLVLKKTGDVSLDSGSTPLTAAASAVTSTLSAADTTGATTPAPSSALISAQLGSDEWQQAIGQQVLMQVRNGQQNAELRLHPESLGALQISLQIDGANQAQIHLASGHSQVRSALEDALPQLRAALADSSINLGQSSVGADATPNWTGNGQDNAGGRSAQAFSVDTVATGADETLSTAPVAASGRAAGIDTFA